MRIWEKCEKKRLIGVFNWLFCHYLYKYSISLKKSYIPMEHFLPSSHITKDWEDIRISPWCDQNVALFVKNGDTKREVFQTTDVGLQMANLLFTPDVRNCISWNVLDNGTGSSVQWIAMSLLTQWTIVFHDVNKHALEHAKTQIERNNVKNKCLYILEDYLYNRSDIPLISFCVSNLPQNRELEMCWDGGSELQIRETLKIGKILNSQGNILTKSVSYADSIHSNDRLKKMYRIEKISDAQCLNPNTQEPAEVEYFLLEKR